MKDCLNYIYNDGGYAQIPFLWNRMEYLLHSSSSDWNGILPQTEAEKGKFEAACKRNAFGRKIHSMAICNGISQCSFRDAALGEINW